MLLYHDVKIGDKIIVSGTVITLLEKTGRVARIRVETDIPITVKKAEKTVSYLKSQTAK